MFYATQKTLIDYHANYAAKHVKQWGIYSASRYAFKRGVPAEVLIKAIANTSPSYFPKHFRGVK